MARTSFTERRRARLARRVAALDAMESRSMITESLGIMALGIGIPATAALVDKRSTAESAIEDELRRERSRRDAASQAATASVVNEPTSVHRKASGGPVRHGSEPAAQNLGPARDSGDWLSLGDGGAESGAISLGILPGAGMMPDSQVGGSMAPRGGFNPAKSGAITPLRLPPPATANSGASGTLISAAAPSTSGTSRLASSPNKGPGAPIVTASQPTASSQSSPITGAITSATLDPTVSAATPTSGGSPIGKGPMPGPGPATAGPTQGTFTNFPLYTLDYNDGMVMFPGFNQLAFRGASVDLRAQVRNTAVQSYSWDTTNLTDATGITGTNTYRLQFSWKTTVATSKTDSVTLTVTNTL
jgi:hypothetical protein